MPFGGSVRPYTLVFLDNDLSPAEAAALHEGLAHPARVAAMRVLREHGPMPLSELRRRVSEMVGSDLDTRSMQFHAARMERAGLVDVGKDRVALLRDVTLKLRGA